MTGPQVDLLRFRLRTDPAYRDGFADGLRQAPRQPLYRETRQAYNEGYDYAVTIRTEPGA